MKAPTTAAKQVLEFLVPFKFLIRPLACALNRLGAPRDKRWAAAVKRVGLHDAVLAQIYEDHAAACTRAAEQCDDPVFRGMLISLALQWRLAAREEVAKQSSQPKI